MIQINFTGSISGSTLDVTNIPSGSLVVGYIIYGVGVLPNTKILKFGTGSGGVGTYYLTTSQTIGSISMSANSEVNLINNYQSLDGSAVVSFYQVDLGSSILYFTNEKNEKLLDPVWQTQTYTAIPIEVKGFEVTGKQFPRPILKLSNYAAVMSGLVKQYQDLVGFKFTRKRTKLKYLDAVNFVAGNAFADPNTYYIDDVYYVNRKISENRLYVEFELTSALDISGIKLPRRQIIQNTCMWKYRSAECSYTGGNYYNTNDGVETLLVNDVCGKRISSCKLRFPGAKTVLPYGGFPGASLTL